MPSDSGRWSPNRRGQLDGVLSFYLAMVAFCTWYVVNSYVVLKALAHQGGGSQAQAAETIDALTNADRGTPCTYYMLSRCGAEMNHP